MFMYTCHIYLVTYVCIYIYIYICICVLPVPYGLFLTIDAFCLFSYSGSSYRPPQALPNPMLPLATCCFTDASSASNVSELSENCVFN